MVRRWLVESTYAAGLVFAVCMAPGCSGESADPDAPEKRRELPEAPPFQRDSQASESLDHPADAALFNVDDATDDVGLELPPTHRASTVFAGADEPPLPDAVLNELLAAGPELHQPRTVRARAIPTDCEEPPLPWELADARNAETTSDARRKPREDAAAVTSDVDDTARALLSQSRLNGIPGETTNVAFRSPPTANDLAADVGNAPSVASGPPTARDLRMARRTREWRERQPSNRAARRGGLSSPRYERVLDSAARFDRSGVTAENRSTIVESALGEPQPATRLTIPFAEASAATSESGAFELRPVPDAVQ